MKFTTLHAGLKAVAANLSAESLSDAVIAVARCVDPDSTDDLMVRLEVADVEVGVAVGDCAQEA